MDIPNSDDINYEYILMRHIDKLSTVLTVVEPETVNMQANGSVMRFKERGEDKLESFVWGVKLLVRMIPNLMRDDKFKNDLEESNKNFNENYEKTQDRNASDLARAFADFFASINLLDRKGFLLKNRVTGRERTAWKMKQD